ncbi:hypothetical protein BHE90_017088 [Fusarium euwallaceae]|uniref:CBM21 domain-containing protein n=1 Tax=Fusarium euwallaceae TaxID=1147111 RepID=A0A430KYJ9_9HYPO|nr:hypothetical protein BHE90_017088 [Fusarium euwallaceae]
MPYTSPSSHPPSYHRKSTRTSKPVIRDGSRSMPPSCGTSDDRAMSTSVLIHSSLSGSDKERWEPQIRGLKIHDPLLGVVSQIRMQQPAPRCRLQTTMQEHGDGQACRKCSERLSFSTNAIDDLAENDRKTGHVQTTPEPRASLANHAPVPLPILEEEANGNPQKKPRIVRKKSGELVRPALRLPSRRRPSSMSSTLAFSKAVHFDSHLECVRHFLQVDCPLAVNAGSSPIDGHDIDAEYPLPDTGQPKARSPYRWEILKSNFPSNSASRRSSPVWLEDVWLSNDQKTLQGSVAVANFAFQKSVTCRFTMDCWETISEVSANYSDEIRPRETPGGHDRFTFSIELSDTTGLESKSLSLCIRYSVNGLDFWDNNDLRNFRFGFRKKHLPQSGRHIFQGASSHPANALLWNSGSTGNPTAHYLKSTSVNFEELRENENIDHDEPIHEYLGRSNSTPGFRLKSKSTGNLRSHAVTGGFDLSNGMAFSNRYDFDTSLSDAIREAKDSGPKDKDELHMKANVRGANHTLAVLKTRSAHP